MPHSDSTAAGLPAGTMNLNQAPNTGRYTGVAMLLHWLIAVMIIANVAIVWIVDYLPDDDVRPMINTHKSIGITVLGLAVLRVLWRIANPPPPLPAETSRFEKAASHAAHLALYGLIFLMPLTGYIHDSAWDGAARNPNFWFGLFEWPRIGIIMSQSDATKLWIHSTFSAIHASLGYVLYGLLALHILAALKHQFVDHQAELQRILPWGKV